MKHSPALPNNTDDDDRRPLPLIIADRWEFGLQFHDVDGMRYYSVQDWLRGVAQKQDVRRMWDMLKKRLDGDVSTSSGHTTPGSNTISVRQFAYRQADGRTYQRDYVSAEGLYAITQRLDVTTGLRRVVLEFLAKSGVFVDTMRRDPQARAEFGATAGAEAVVDATIGQYRKLGRDEHWIAARLEGVVTRKEFTTALKEVVLRFDPTMYAKGTEKIYAGLWKRTTAQLRSELNMVSKKRSMSPRENFGEYALIYTRLAEKMATDRLRDVEIVPEDLAMKIVYEAAELISRQASATSNALGIDLITEKPLLPKK